MNGPVESGPIGGGVAVAARPSSAVGSAPEHALPAFPQEANSAQLLQLAIERGIPVEQLQVLATLHERMSAIDARKAFFDALATFQRECPSIKKTSTANVTSSRTASKFTYTFADLDEIVSTIRPYADANGFSWNWDSEVSANGQMLTVTCTLRHVRGHFETSRMTLPVESSAAMSPQQKYGAAMTFAQRRTLSSVFGLVTTDAEDPKVDESKITDDQVTEIADLITESGANRDAFLEYIGVKTVAEIPARQYQEAVSGLRQKLATKRAARRDR